MTRISSIAFIALLALPGVCSAASTPPTTKQEVATLFSRLEASGCQFSRNGTWYDAKAASAHLSKKYQYLLDQNLVSRTEDFIARAATESSISGQPYQVKCNDAAPVNSAAWFKAELAKYRKSVS